VNSYIPILILFSITIVLASAMVGLAGAISHVFKIARPSLQKSQPYECGMTPIGGARVRFPVKFYLVAMLFILFDVEAIFLYPWAVVHRGLGWFGLVEMVIFVLILVVGYVYIWKRGGFEWD